MNATVRVLAIAAALVLGCHAAWLAGTSRAFDFRAFYCAGVASNAGADPYRYQPLQRCELATAGLSPSATEAVIPAPLPGYDIAILRLVATLPYPVARALWMIAVVGAFSAAAFASARLGGTTTRFAWAVFAIAGVSSLNSGQIALFAVAGIALAAGAIACEREKLTVLALALAWVEPHLALGATLAVFIGRPRSRLPVLGLGAGLLALSVLGIGPAANLEYAMTALARHAASEVAHERQLSLTHLLHLFGANDATALRLGAGSYLATLACGTALAVRGARSDPRLLVVLPALFSVLGGTYIHEAQMTAALPALFLLVERKSGHVLLGVAMGVLSLPWMQVLADPIVDASSAAIVLMLVLAPNRELRAGLTVTLPLLLASAIGRLRMVPNAADRYQTFHPHAAAAANASDVWALWVPGTFTSNVALMTCAASVTWTALALATFLLCRHAVAAPRASTSG